jgi:anti-anti-sigma regulatory factor
MEITVTHEPCRVPVTVLTPVGDLDRATFKSLLSIADQLYQEGTRYILIDMSQVPFVSSAGLMALHGVVLAMQGEAVDDGEDGWGAFQKMRAAEPTLNANVKLLSPRPKVTRVLETSGFNLMLPIFSDRQAALASF